MSILSLDEQGKEAQGYLSCKMLVHYSVHHNDEKFKKRQFFFKIVGLHCLQ